MIERARERIQIPGLTGERAALILGAAAVLTVLAPFGSGAMPALARGLYWASLCALGLGLSVAASRLVSRRLPSLGVRAEAALLSLLVSLPLAVVALGVAQLSSLAPSAGPARTLFSVWAVVASMTAIGMLAGRAARRDGAVAPEPAGAKISERLPLHLREASCGPSRRRTIIWR